MQRTQTPRQPSLHELALVLAQRNPEVIADEFAQEPEFGFAERGHVAGDRDGIPLGRDGNGIARHLHDSFRLGRRSGFPRLIGRCAADLNAVMAIRATVRSSPSTGKVRRPLPPAIDRPDFSPCGQTRYPGDRRLVVRVQLCRAGWRDDVPAISRCPQAERDRTRHRAAEILIMPPALDALTAWISAAKPEV